MRVLEKFVIISVINIVIVTIPTNITNATPSDIYSINKIVKHAPTLIEPNLFNDLQSRLNHSPTQPTWYTYIYNIFEKLYPQFQSESQTQVHMCRKEQTFNDDSLIIISSNNTLIKPSRGYDQERIQVFIIEKSTPNAYALPSPDRIFISRSLLELIENESELAFVIAHEMAHIKYHHFSPHLPIILNEAQLARIALIHQSWEYEADNEALRLIQGAGFAPESSVSLLKRLSEYENTYSHKKAERPFHNHPTIEQRVSAVKYRLNSLMLAGN
jgi:predicted Zn-dependent protease